MLIEVRLFILKNSRCYTKEQRNLNHDNMMCFYNIFKFESYNSIVHGFISFPLHMHLLDHKLVRCTNQQYEDQMFYSI